MSDTDYVIAIAIGPCSETDARSAMEKAHMAIRDIPNITPASSLYEYDEGNLIGAPVGDCREVLS